MLLIIVTDSWKWKYFLTADMSLVKNFRATKRGVECRHIRFSLLKVRKIIAFTTKEGTATTCN